MTVRPVRWSSVVGWARLHVGRSSPSLSVLTTCVCVESSSSQKVTFLLLPSCRLSSDLRYFFLVFYPVLVSIIFLKMSCFVLVLCLYSATLPRTSKYQNCVNVAVNIKMSHILSQFENAAKLKNSTNFKLGQIL